MYKTEEEKFELKTKLTKAINESNKRKRNGIIEATSGTIMASFTTYSLIGTTLRNNIFTNPDLMIGTCFLAGSSAFLIVDGIKTYKDSSINSKVLQKELYNVTKRK